MLVPNINSKSTLPKNY